MGERGTGLLLRGGLVNVAAATLSCSAGIALLASVFTGRLAGPLGPPVRVAGAVAGVLFLYGSIVSVLVASAMVGLVLILQFQRHRATTGPRASL